MSASCAICPSCGSSQLAPHRSSRLARWVGPVLELTNGMAGLLLYLVSADAFRCTHCGWVFKNPDYERKVLSIRAYQVAFVAFCLLLGVFGFAHYFGPPDGSSASGPLQSAAAAISLHRMLFGMLGLLVIMVCLSIGLVSSRRNQRRSAI